uniref:Uncharacterized protein n=1 Tax=Magallana gigas TaxID=29159 RepID=A0A8W8JMQ9_MAGGI
MQFKPALLADKEVKTYVWNKERGVSKDPSFAKFDPSVSSELQIYYNDEHQVQNRLIHYPDEPATLYLTNLKKSDEQRYTVFIGYVDYVGTPTYWIIDLQVQDVCFEKPKEVGKCAVSTCYTGENGVLKTRDSFRQPRFRPEQIQTSGLTQNPPLQKLRILRQTQKDILSSLQKKTTQTALRRPSQDFNQKQKDPIQKPDLQILPEAPPTAPILHPRRSDPRLFSFPPLSFLTPSRKTSDGQTGCFASLLPPPPEQTSDSSSHPHFRSSQIIPQILVRENLSFTQLQDPSIRTHPQPSPVSSPLSFRTLRSDFTQPPPSSDHSSLFPDDQSTQNPRHPLQTQISDHIPVQDLSFPPPCVQIGPSPPPSPKPLSPPPQTTLLPQDLFPRNPSLFLTQSSVPSFLRNDFFFPTPARPSRFPSSSYSQNTSFRLPLQTEDPSVFLPRPSSPRTLFSQTPHRFLRKLLLFPRNYLLSDILLRPLSHFLPHSDSSQKSSSLRYPASSDPLRSPPRVTSTPSPLPLSVSSQRHSSSPPQAPLFPLIFASDLFLTFLSQTPPTPDSTDSSSSDP